VCQLESWHHVGDEFVTTRRGTRITKRADSIGTRLARFLARDWTRESLCLQSHRRWWNWEIHARLSDMFAKTQSIENGLIQSRSPHKREHVC